MFEHPDEDAADARRVLGGDISAFEGIVRRWQGRLVNLAWRFCRDRSMAEDMAQEAFVKAFRALDTYRGEAVFSTWLTAIALNTFRSALRSRGPAPIAVDPYEPRDGRPSALTTLVWEERTAAVRRLVTTLPARYRDPIVLYYFEEMNMAEVSRVLRIPEGTLKARIHRGKAFLKRRLIAAGVLGPLRTSTER